MAQSKEDSPSEGADRGASVWEVARAVFAISWFAVGGPSAHLAILEAEFVDRRKWVSHSRFLELFALASLLPGPSSTQVVIGLGMARAGRVGGVVALLVWMTPAVLLMTALALGIGWWLSADRSLDALQGLYPAAIALLGAAGWRLSRKAVQNGLTLALLALGAAVAVVGQLDEVRSLIAPVNPAYRFPVVILLAGFIASVATRNADTPQAAIESHGPASSARVGALLLIVFGAVFVGLTAAGSIMGPEAGLVARAVDASDSLYRSGSIVVGGGQVVLPLLHDEFVLQSGWVSDESFWAGFGVVQAAPGPLFSFSAFLGGLAMTSAGGGPAAVVVGAVIGAISLFLPGALLWFGVDPFWNRVSRWPRVRRGLPGAQAAAVGLIVGSFWIMCGRVLADWLDFTLLGAGLVAAALFRVSPLLVLIVCFVLGMAAWWFDVA